VKELPTKFKIVQSRIKGILKEKFKIKTKELYKDVMNLKRSIRIGKKNKLN